MRRVLAIAAAVLLPAGLSLAQARPQAANAGREKVVVILCDVTSSLDVGERAAVAELAGSIIRKLSPPVRYEVLPILLDPERARPLISENVPRLVKPSDKERYRRRLAQMPRVIDGQMASLYERVNGPGQDPDRSCIIASIGRAAGFFEQFRGEGAVDLHLIILSDMIEECRENPLGVPIRLNHRDITKEVSIARRPGEFPNLSGVQVALIVPPTSQSLRGEERPSLRMLKTFWAEIMAQHKLSAKELADPDRFYFGSGLPERLKSPW